MTCYRIPAERHFSDANSLMGIERSANASHLFGLSAECAFKCILASFRHIPDSTRRPSDPYGCHINDLWDLYHTALHGRAQTKYHTGMTGEKNPFNQWNVNDRYMDNPCNLTEVMRHKSGAHIAMKMLRLAIMDRRVQ